MRIRLLIILLLSVGSVKAQTIPVRIAENSSGYTLLRNNEPYYIKGAGGADHLDELIYLGGNSIRTWGWTKLKKRLTKRKKTV